MTRLISMSEQARNAVIYYLNSHPGERFASNDLAKIPAVVQSEIQYDHFRNLLRNCTKNKLIGRERATSPGRDKYAYYSVLQPQKNPDPSDDAEFAAALAALADFRALEASENVESAEAPPPMPDVKIDLVKSTGKLRVVFRGISIEIGVIE